ncbi:unnamed protein product [Aphanomyces euteiches]|nr:hypothetical protein AeRB84_013971 [Aphanomyces euteiches]
MFKRFVLVLFVMSLVVVGETDPPQTVLRARTLEPRDSDGSFHVVDMSPLDFIKTFGKTEERELLRHMGQAYLGSWKKPSKYAIQEMVFGWVNRTVTSAKKWQQKWKNRLARIDWHEKWEHVTNWTAHFNASREIEMLKMSFMTFDQVAQYLNITRPPPATTEATWDPLAPFTASSYHGPTTYKHVPATVAKRFEPFQEYALQYYAPSTANPLLPAEDYPWTWNASIVRIKSLLESSLLNDTNQTNATNKTALSLFDTIERLRQPFHIMSGLPVILEDIPLHSILPFPSPSDALADGKRYFYGYPSTSPSSSSSSSAQVWLRSSVTIYTPTLNVSTNSSGIEVELHLRRFFDLAFDADVAGLLLGLQAPSTVWLSPFDRISDEFADLCLGDLVAARERPDVPTDATALYDGMTRNSATHPSCLWNGNSRYYTAKRSSTRPFNRSAVVAAPLALYIAKRAANITEMKATMRSMRQTQIAELLANATEQTVLPVSAMGHGVVFHGANPQHVLLEVIKEPEPIHAIHRVLIRLGESSLLSWQEMDQLLACTCLHLLGMAPDKSVSACRV